MSLAEKVVEAIKELASGSPFVFVFIALAIVGFAIFWEALFVVFQGFIYAIVAIGAIVLVLMVWLKVKYKKASLKQLIAKKKRALSALKAAEKRYMKRQMSEPDFNKIFKEKQKELIETEALIDQIGNKDDKVNKEILAVQTKKRHILKSLLDEKKRILKEMDIAEKRYMRRKIDSKTYQAIVQKNQEKFVELEAHIDELYSEANVSKVMENLKQKLVELEIDSKKSKRKKKESEKEQQLRIAKEIVEQLSKK